MEPTALKPNDWNDVDVVIDANIFRPWVNTSASGGGAADDESGDVWSYRDLCRRFG